MAQQHLDRLSSTDLSFLTNESSSSHMHVGAIMIFEGPAPGYDDLLEHVRSRLRLVPRFRQKLMFPPVQAGRPFWIDAPNADCAQWKLTVAFTVQPPRPRNRGIIRQLAAFFGAESDPRPVPVGRWSAERTFPDRDTLVRLSRDVWPVLFDEVRTAAGASGVVTFQT